MTEHAAVVFVFFFLAEYGSIVLMCILTSILFLGGYLPIYSLAFLINLLDYLYYLFNFSAWVDSSTLSNIYISHIVNSPYMYFFELGRPAQHFFYSLGNNPNLEGLIYSIMLGLKSSMMIFIFIWVRASRRSRNKKLYQSISFLAKHELCYYYLCFWLLLYSHSFHTVDVEIYLIPPLFL